MKYTFIILCILSFETIQAQPGTLDNSFGSDGKVQTHTFGLCNAVTLQKDGKILAGGDGTYQTDTGFILIRYISNGEVDSSFGTNGFSVVGFDDYNYGSIYGLAVQNDGKIVAAGSDNHVFLVRYNTDGGIDSSFGNNGIVTKEFGYAEWIKAVQLQGDGKIVVAGLVQYENYITKPIVIRFLPDGNIDKSFGSNGASIISKDNATTANDLAIQEDGKIVIGGAADAGDNTFFLARLNTNGSLDETFGINGTVITRFDGNDYNEEYINSVAIQPDGKILAGGIGNLKIIGTTHASMAIVRYENNGKPDATFGNNGLVYINFPNKTSELKKLLLQNNEKIVAVGNTFRNNSLAAPDFALARLNSDGLADSSFGSNAEVITDFGGNDACNAAALQTDGKIVTVGSTYVDSENFYYDLARYNGDRTQLSPITKVKRFIKKHLPAHIYPNPVKDVVAINGLNASANTTLTIVNAQGFTLKRIDNIKAPAYEINVSQLPKGTYYLKAEDETGSATEQFMKE